MDFVFERVFPGDEQIPDDALKALGQGKCAWPKISALLTESAAALGLPVSRETTERWSRMWAWTWFLDNLLDDSPDRTQALSLYRTLVADGPAALPAVLPEWLDQNLVTMATLFWNSTAMLSSQPAITKMAFRIGDQVPRKSAAHNPWTYGWLAWRENTWTGEIIASCLSDGERSHRKFPAFRRWVRHLAHLAGALDNLWDMAKDYTAGLSAVKPHVANVQMMRLWTVVALVPHLRYPRILRRCRAFMGAAPQTERR